MTTLYDHIRYTLPCQEGDKITGTIFKDPTQFHVTGICTTCLTPESCENLVRTSLTEHIGYSTSIKVINIVGVDATKH